MLNTSGWQTLKIVVVVVVAVVAALVVVVVVVAVDNHRSVKRNKYLCGS